MGKAVVLMLCLALFTVGIVFGQKPSVKSLPPSIVETVPRCGETNVDATKTTQIKVTYSKEMMDESWSWARISDDTFPKIVGEPKYLQDKKTCMVNVELKPKKTYVIWLNLQKLGNFKDVDGNSAIPYLLVFETK